MAAATTRRERKRGGGRVDTDGMADEEEKQQWEVQSWLASKAFPRHGPRWKEHRQSEGR